MSTDQLPVVYALIWRIHRTDAEFNREEFNRRLPQLMARLRGLRDRGKLVVCGGGGFANHSGGLTLVRADSPEEALEIGTTELLVWDVFYADLNVARTW